MEKATAIPPFSSKPNLSLDVLYPIESFQNIIFERKLEFINLTINLIK